MKTKEEVFGIHKSTGVDVTSKWSDQFQLKYMQDGTYVNKVLGSYALCMSEKQRLIKFEQHTAHLFKIDPA